MIIKWDTRYKMELPPINTYQLIIITAVVVLLSKKLTNFFLKKIVFPPFKYLKDTIYKWIAPRNPFSISLHSYKKHIMRSNLARIENPVGPPLRVPLEHAYAPLKLISGNTQESVDLFSHTNSTDRFIVLGGPGTGKTTLMKSLLVNIINKKTDSELDDIIPVFIVLRNLASRRQSVEEAIIDTFESYHFPGAQKFIKSAISQGRMLIILDGLDEVGINREFVSSRIRTFCEYDDQRSQKNRIIVTCREHSYRTEDLRDVIPTVVRVEPFANHHMRIFLKGWPVHEGKSAIELYGIIQNDSLIRDICRNPLLLTILTGLYLDDVKFQLPTSRDRFYQSSIEELLIKRPARRSIKQLIDPVNKMKILERVCLERLETVQVSDDPEQLTLDAFRKNSNDVLQKEIDIHVLIKEFVDINGIIKPIGDDTYTCAHRTIQEYFTAREARRTCELEEVIEFFGERNDFIEVIYFYCGLINNIPQLNNILDKFIIMKKWIEGGRCILNMTEVPDEKYIRRICEELTNKIVRDKKYESELEILSSLAQRKEDEFKFARRNFNKVIDFLSTNDNRGGASAIESVLSSSPEAAMKVIPGLLQHHSARRKRAAVKLLRDIDTDESFDILVRLLKNEDELIKYEAGKILAELIKSRRDDLIARKYLLPQREDLQIWPLENYFPGSLAIPIVEAVVNYDKDTKNRAINCALKFIKIKKTRDSSQRKFLKQWKKLPFHLILKTRIKKIGTALFSIGLYFILLISVFMVILLLYGRQKDSLILLSINPNKIYFLNSNLLEDTESAAKDVVSEIKSKYSPNASGLYRILPWNWFVEPIVPEQAAEAYKIAYKYMFLSKILRIKMDELDKLTSFHGIVSAEKIDKLLNTLKLLNSNLFISNSQFTYFISYRNYFQLFIFFIPIFLFILLLKLSSRFYSVREGQRYIHRLLDPVSIFFYFEKPIIRHGYVTFRAIYFIIIITIVPLLIMPGISYNKITFWESILLFILPYAFILNGLTLRLLNIPKNPLTSVIDDLQEIKGSEIENLISWNDSLKSFTRSWKFLTERN